ncbi:MAG: aspartate aminotransferase family protein, partial [Actinobacteria bacterium]|nr:aspartate aminotransferase family protein [Actinomycetota bacterium]
HMWMYFSRMGSYHEGASVPIIVRGEGAYIFDDRGRRYLDGLSGLFTVQMGHGREEIAAAAYKQMMKLAHFPIWGYGNPPAIELAEKLASLTPQGLDRVFFTTAGGEAVESAFKLVKQYFKMTGKPLKHKVISRSIAYHGTTQGALSITGIPAAKQWFEPLVPGAHKVPNTNFYRAPEYLQNDIHAFSEWASSRIEEAILMEGADTVAAVFVEPVQNSGGCFPPPPGYLKRVREICDKYDVIMVCDEVITGFGRIGDWFASNRYGIVPDIITCAKGMTSGYAPMGAMIVNERLYEPFSQGTNSFLHGFTWGGHPMGAAVALANIDLMERENINEHVLSNENAFKKTLEKLYDLDIVGEVRGAGYFYGIELVRDKKTRETFTAEESERLLRGFLSTALYDGGLYCRTDDRGDPVIQLAPPLICDQSHFDEIEQILRGALVEAMKVI